MSETAEFSTWWEKHGHGLSWQGRAYVARMAFTAGRAPLARLRDVSEAAAALLSFPEVCGCEDKRCSAAFWRLHDALAALDKREAA